jgi:hypothetical protein
VWHHTSMLKGANMLNALRARPNCVLQLSPISRHFSQPFGTGNQLQFGLELTPSLVIRCRRMCLHLAAWKTFKHPAPTCLHNHSILSKKCGQLFDLWTFYLNFGPMTHHSVPITSRNSSVLAEERMPRGSWSHGTIRTRRSFTCCGNSIVASKKHNQGHFSQTTSRLIADLIPFHRNLLRSIPNHAATFSILFEILNILEKFWSNT